jgi:hypothetical protein
MVEESIVVDLDALKFKSSFAFNDIDLFELNNILSDLAFNIILPEFIIIWGEEYIFGFIIVEGNTP